MELEELRKIFGQHKHMLIAQYNSEGAAIAKDQLGYHIVLYFADLAQLREAPPLEWMGIRLVVKHTRKIEAQ